MDYVGVLKASDNMNNGVGLTDVGKELIPKPLSLGSAFYKSCNINELDGGRSDLFGVVQIPQSLKSLIRNCNYAHVRINGCKGIVCCQRPCICK